MGKTSVIRGWGTRRLNFLDTKWGERWSIWRNRPDLDSHVYCLAIEPPVSVINNDMSKGIEQWSRQERVLIDSLNRTLMSCWTSQDCMRKRKKTLPLTCKTKKEKRRHKDSTRMWDYVNVSVCSTHGQFFTFWQEGELPHRCACIIHSSFWQLAPEPCVVQVFRAATETSPSHDRATETSPQRNRGLAVLGCGAISKSECIRPGTL